MGVGGQCHAPVTLPAGMTSYPLYGKLVGPQSWSRRVKKILPHRYSTPGVPSP